MKKYLLLIIFSFICFNLQAAEKIDCSVHKKFSKDWWGCKKGNLTKGSKESGKGFFKNIIDYQKKSFSKKD